MVIVVRISTFAFVLLFAVPVLAHVSQGAIVLLLPTDVYAGFGVAAVVATVLLTVLTPPRWYRALFDFQVHADAADSYLPAQMAVSLGALAALVALVAVGVQGSRDPLENLLPLFVFSGWWLCFPFVQLLFGDVWRWVNPWGGVVQLVRGGTGLFCLPDRVGFWPAVAGYLLGAVYALTDIAPDDPSRLAVVVAGYWVFTFVMCILFGRQWLHRGEAFTVLFDLVARLSPLGYRPLRLRFPGQGIVSARAVSRSLAIFSVTVLALGSFDGLNETFWWMARLGINPLEFPGRSAVVWQNRAGMLGAIVLLNMVFALAVWLGWVLTGRRVPFTGLWAALALTTLPIALGYHLAHYLTAGMINLQYLVKALNDPFHTGAALLGWDRFYVTTSFFNQHDSVQRIWLTQAGAIVAAHMLAVILSHAIALRIFNSHTLAVWSQLPVAVFMVAYTMFGLWLLASPVAL